MLDAFKNLAPNYDAEAVESKIPQIYKQTWYGNDDSFSILELVLVMVVVVVVVRYWQK